MSEIDRFNEHAATWDEQPGRRERATHIADAVRAAVPLGPSMTALEIGGGTGLLARALAGDLARVDVTDVAPGMVEAAAAVLAGDERYPGWRAFAFDIERDPLPESRYDLVLSQLALHHMGDIPAVLGRAASLLNPGGWVALVDLDHDADNGFHKHLHDFHGHPGFERTQVEQWLREAGFDEVSTRTAHHEPKEVDGVERRFPLFLATGRLGAEA